MDTCEHHTDEELIQQLNDPDLLAEYKKPYDEYRPGIVARILGTLLVFSGTLVYGKKPSYQKFKAIEVIARIPYQSWEVAAYTLLTGMYANEKKAITLSRLSQFSRVAQDNETMHVVVLSQIVKREHSNNFILHSIIPLVFALFYFWSVYLLYLFSPRSALELNYLFESHAFAQYQIFLEQNEDMLKKKTVESDFLNFYGRHVISEYELFQSIRNDEIVHRNRSIQEIEALKG